MPPEPGGDEAEGLGSKREVEDEELEGERAVNEGKERGRKRGFVCLCCGVSLGRDANHLSLLPVFLTRFWERPGGGKGELPWAASGL